MVDRVVLEFPRPDRARQQAECCRPLNKIRGDRRTRSARAAGRGCSSRREPLVLRGLVSQLARGARRAASRPQAAMPLPAALLPRCDGGRDARRAGHRRALLLQRGPHRLQFQDRAHQARRGARRNRAATRRATPPGRSTWARPPSTPCLPGFRDRERYRPRDAQAAGQHLDRQSHAHRRASRSAGQPRLRGGRPPALHAVSARTARQSLHRPAGLHARRAGRSAWWISRSPDLARFPRFAEALQARAGRRARPGRCDLHPEHVVASHRVARRLQRAGQLLVAPVAGVHGFADRARSCWRS